MPTTRGSALIANEFIDAINKKYDAYVPHINAVAYDGVKFQNQEICWLLSIDSSGN
jgi:hypothetical protein